MRIIKNLLIIIMLLTTWLWAGTTMNGVLVGKVEQIFSGEILTIVDNQQRYYIRLAGIDAPDPKQPFGADSLNVLNEMIGDKVVVVRQIGTDTCGRIIGLMWLNGDNGLDISSRMVADGAAWVYEPYTKNEFLENLEKTAREQKRGLWALAPEKRIPPWEWRKKARFEGQTPIDACPLYPQSSGENMYGEPEEFQWTPAEFS